MATISAGQVKQLREQTGAGIMDCKEALTESNGDMDKSVEFLRKKGLATAAKRAGRAMSEGVVQSYIHMGGKLGVMVEVNCESGFRRQERRLFGVRKKCRHAHRRHQSGRHHQGGSARVGDRKGKGNLQGTGP